MYVRLHFAPSAVDPTPSIASTATAAPRNRTIPMAPPFARQAFFTAHAGGRAGSTTIDASSLL